MTWGQSSSVLENLASWHIVPVSPTEGKVGWGGGVSGSLGSDGRGSGCKSS